MSPLVSVIVPNYNHAAFLGKRIESILAQTMTDIEVILLDDASTDGSADILRAFASDPRVSHLVVNQQNGASPFRQWRKGCALARGTWIWIAESDDSCAPDMLERMLAANLKANDTLGLVFAQSGFIDDKGVRFGSMLDHTSCFHPDPFKEDFVMEGCVLATRYLKVKNVIPNASAAMVRRALLADEEAWEGVESMRQCGDWLLWSRLMAHINVGFVSKELNAFRHHADTTRRHTTAELKQRYLVEQAAVRSALATYPQIDQEQEEERMYDAWFRYFTYQELFSGKLWSIRIRGRSRTSFLSKFLSFKWKMYRERKHAR